MSPPVNYANYLKECPFSQDDIYKVKLDGKEGDIYRVSEAFVSS